MSGDTANTGTGDRDRHDASASSPGIDESLRALNAARRDTVDAARGTGRALRRLVAADLALARSAFGRGLAWAGAAIVFGASAWLLVAATLIALMQRYGLSWLASLSIAALLSLAVTGFAAWKVGRYFDYTGLHATRRQLSKLGVFDEDETVDDDPPPGTAHDARASEHGGP